MTMTKKEQTIVLALGGALLLILGYWFANNTVASGLASVQKEINTKNKELKDTKTLIKEQTDVDAEWNKLISNGLATQPSLADKKAQDLISVLGNQNRVNIESVKSSGQGSRLTKPGGGKSDFEEHTYKVVASGVSRGIWPFLFAMETSGLPMRISKMGLRTHKDGTDDLGLDMEVIMLVYSPPVAAPTKPAQRTRAATQGSAKTRSATSTASATSAALPESTTKPEDIAKFLEDRRAKELAISAASPATSPATNPVK